MTNVNDFLPQRMRSGKQPVLRALTKSINADYAKVNQLIQNCIDQFFLTTATGKYLVQLGEQEGFVMPQNSGLDVRAYRILVPLMVSSPKQIKRTFEEIIESFYGVDRTRPSTISLVPEPYALIDGDDLWVTTEKETVKIAFLQSKVSNINAVTAPELAAIINSSQGAIFADTSTDKATGFRYLRLTTTTIGASASMHITGGTLQNVIQFPTLVATEQTTGTTWNVTKEQTYSDITRLQWNGAGTNPRIFLVQKGDVVTIRDVGGLESELNGSYEILDSGYDYFVIQNSTFALTSGTIVQQSAAQLMFTSKRKTIIYDNTEYGMATETDPYVATITVPAIPPLARRYLSGSAHLHGSVLNVLSFTRNSITVELPAGVDKPIGENQFVLKNKRTMYDFVKKKYHTTGVNDLNPPTYYLDATNPEYNTLPFVNPMSMGIDPIHMEIDSDEFVVTTSFPHGMQTNWGMTIGGVPGAGNVFSFFMNKEHVVKEVLSANKVSIQILDQFNQPLKFSGISFGSFDVYRHLSPQSDGSDFYLQFPSEAAANAAGLQIGMTLQIDQVSGTVIEPFYGSAMKHRKMYVTSFDGANINVCSGLKNGSGGLIISGANGKRSANYASGATYFFDMNSDWNKNTVLSELKACMTAFTPSVNPAYIGSFIFDPQGKQSLMTISKYITKTNADIFKGSNEGVIFVEGVNNAWQNKPFPSSGKLIIDYGSNKAEGPINYIATIENGSLSQIIIDPAYRFTKSHSPGAQVQYIHTLQPYVPTVNGSDYPSYITGTAQARNTLFKLLESLIAGGVFLKADVLLPELRYQDTAIAPFS
jgi:hypothetical protein